MKQKKRDEPIPIEIYTKYRQKILEIIPAPVNQIVDYQFFNNKFYFLLQIKRIINILICFVYTGETIHKF